MWGSWKGGDVQGAGRARGCRANCEARLPGFGDSEFKTKFDQRDFCDLCCVLMQLSEFIDIVYHCYRAVSPVTASFCHRTVHAAQLLYAKLL